MKISLSTALWAVCFLTAWALVLLDVLAGDRSALGTVAGVWLAAQAIGLALSKLHIGIPEQAFWQTCADAPDGGIDVEPNRRGAWFVFELLDHFSLIQYPQGKPAILAKMKVNQK